MEAATNQMHLTCATLYVPGDVGCAALASSLGALRALEVLELQDCGLGDAAACALADALTTTAGSALGGARSRPTTLFCPKPNPNLDPDSDPSLQPELEPQPCDPNPNQASVRSCGVSRSAPILSQTPAARPSPPRCWKAHGCYAARARLEPQPRMRPETQPQPQPPQLPQPPPPRRRAALQSCSWEIRASEMSAPRRSRVRLTPAPCRAAVWPHSVYWFMRQS